MPDRLLIRLAPDGALQWLRQSAGSRVAAARGVGAPPSSVLAAAEDVVVLVPAEDVLLLEVRVTARSAAQRSQAVPFAVEDQILAPLEDQHVAFVPGHGDQVGVGVVARTRLQGWLDTLAAAGIRPDRIVPESLALPLAPDAGSVLVDGGRVIARLAPWSAVACPLEDLPAWLERLRAAGVDPALDIHAARDVRGVAATVGPRGRAAVEPVVDAFVFLAAHLEAAPLNLLGGRFAVAHRVARGTRWWRRVAAIAAAVGVLAFAARGLEVIQLQRSVARLEASMADSVQRTFPDLGAGERSLDPQQVMRSRVDRLRGAGESTGLLRVLGQVAPVLGATTRTELRGLEYRNDVLELGLRAPDVATLDSLREQFAAIPGLDAEVTGLNPLDNGVDGRVRVRGEGR
ncbi:type II secretion system protein GspL [Dokdonella sp. MW10]|uniref:type II secretion system protein GspL n=1 Tax=Dokdonella sp. MW10 TaxID=2992926 RepID=UPI003F7F964A